MNPMTCTDIDERIELFAAGECDAPTEAAIRRHLTGCARCAEAETEARQFLDMMDLRLQEPDRLQRLLDRIEEETRSSSLSPGFAGERAGVRGSDLTDADSDSFSMRAKPLPDLAWSQSHEDPSPQPSPRKAGEREKVHRAAKASRQRWFALAASILLPIGLGIWLTPPAESPASGGAKPELTVALLPDRSVRAHEDFVPAPANLKGVPEAVLSFHFEKDGSAIKAYQEHFPEAVVKSPPPLPPSVDLLLHIHNPTDRPMRLRFDDPRAELRLSLHGPGTVRLAAPAGVDPFAGLIVVDVPPGSSGDLHISRLIGGSRAHPDYLYWTEPGHYRLRATLRIPVESDNRTILTTIGGPQLLIRIDAR